MRIRRRDWPKHSLLSRAGGRAAEDVRQALGVSPTGRIEALERDVAALKRELALSHRHFQGLLLNSNRVPVKPDRDGRIVLYSPDGSVTVQRNPSNAPHVVALSVDPSMVCFPECSEVTASALDAPSTIDGYMLLCLDNGDETHSCVAVPYLTCLDDVTCGE